MQCAGSCLGVVSRSSDSNRGESDAAAGACSAVWPWHTGVHQDSRERRTRKSPAASNAPSQRCLCRLRLQRPSPSESHLRLGLMAPSGSCAWQRLPGLRRAGPRPDSARGVVSWGAARPPCDPTSCWAGPCGHERRVILVRVVVGCSPDGARVKVRTDRCQTPLRRQRGQRGAACRVPQAIWSPLRRRAPVGGGRGVPDWQRLPRCTVPAAPRHWFHCCRRCMVGAWRAVLGRGPAWCCPSPVPS